jgi:hypothetical protein
MVCEIRLLGCCHCCKPGCVPGAVQTIWTDRGVAAELRERVVTEIATKAGETVQNSTLIMRGFLPEHALREYVCSSDQAFNSEACLDQEKAVIETEQRLLATLKRIDRVEGTRIRARLETYFLNDAKIHQEAKSLSSPSVLRCLSGGA